MLSIQTGRTKDAEEFVRNNLSIIGKVAEVSHTRDSIPGDYETTIKGQRETIVVKGGFNFWL